MARKTASKKAQMAAGASDAASVSKAIRMCLDSGKVSLGMDGALKAALRGQGRLVVAAANAPAEAAGDLARYCRLSGLPLLRFEGTSMELGSVCGKPFPVSALVVGDAGNSPILELLKKEKA